MPSARHPVSVLALALCLLPVASVLGDSSARPFWTEQAMYQFGGDLYFIGEASCARTSEEGRNRAFDDGMEELRNYAQATDTSGLLMETQMIYEEPDAPGCPSGSVSVWRLLRVPVDKVATLARQRSRREAPGHEGASAAAPVVTPKDLTPAIGMTEDQLLQRFGRPRRITLRGNESEWYYPQTGLTLYVDADGFLRRWHLAGPQPRQGHTPDPPASGPFSTTAPEEDQLIDLASRLQALQKETERMQSDEPPQTSLARIGRRIYEGKGACAHCHGVSGRGDGPAARLSHLKPTDLTRRETFRFRSTAERFRVIKHGIPDAGMPPTEQLTDAEIRAVLTYLQELTHQ